MMDAVGEKTLQVVGDIVKSSGATLCKKVKSIEDVFHDKM